MIRFVLLVLTLTLGAALSQAPAGVSGRGPLDLTEALSLVANSPAVLDAQLQVDEAQRNLARSRRPVEAQLSASGSGSLQLGSGGPLPGDTEGSSSVGANVGLSGSASFNVFPYGPSARAEVRAGYDLERARLQLRDTTWQTAVSVVRQFTGALRVQEQVVIASRRLALSEMQLGAVEARQQAGAASEADVLQARIGVVTAGNDLVSLQGELASALTELSQTLGVPVPEVRGPLPYELQGDLPEPPNVDPELTLEARSDVAEARLGLLEAQLELTAARRASDPTLNFDLDFTGANGPASARLGASFDTESFNPSVSASVGVGTESSGSASSRVALGAELAVPLMNTADESVSNARRAVECARVSLARTTSTASALLEAAERRIHVSFAGAQMAGSVLEGARLAFERAEVQFENGTISAIGFTQAQISLLEAGLQNRRSLDNYFSELMALALELALDPMEVLP